MEIQIHESRFITEPRVHLIAQTTFIEKGLGNWLDANPDIAEADTNPDTPISNLLDAAMGLDADAHGDRLIELAGRHCYRSFAKGRDHDTYIANIIEQEHGSVLEHPTVTFIIEGVSRSLTHELVRHRVGVAISQESQRYVDARDVRFVIPPLLLQDGFFIAQTRFKRTCSEALAEYGKLISDILASENSLNTDKDMRHKRIREAARSVLPNAAETRLVWTVNMNMLRHVLKRRGDLHADLEIRRLALKLFETVSDRTVFNDMSFDNGDCGIETIRQG